MWEKTSEFTIVVILTKDTINVAEMTAMCGRFASHVEVIEGSPVDLISSIACYTILHARGLHSRQDLRRLLDLRHS